MSHRSLLAAAAAAACLLFGLLASALAEDFDTSALPKAPTTFEEQKLWDAIETARRYPDLAQDAHTKLADYYDKHGLTALASKERAAANPASATAAPPAQPAQPNPAPSAAEAQPDSPGGQPAAASPASPDQPSTDADPLDPQLFDLSAFPSAPTNFEEQLIRDSLDDPNTLTDPTLLAFAHRQLGRYYAALGRVDLAGTEYARALVAVPEDPRSYSGLAALSEAVGTDAGDGTLSLRDAAQQLQDRADSPRGPEEPEPQVNPEPDPGQWQETTAEFNRRMNYLYTSNAWSNVYRTAFPNLYGR